MDGKQLREGLHLRERIGKRGWRLDAFRKIRFFIISEFLSVNWPMTGNENELSIRRHAPHLIRRHELPRDFGRRCRAPAHLSGRGLRKGLDGLFSQRIRQRPRRAAAVLQRRREIDLHMAIAGDGVILRIDFIELPHALSDDADFDAIARTDGERFLDGFKLAELREFVEHQEKPLLFRLRSILRRVKFHVAHELRQHRIDEQSQDGAQLIDVIRLQN